MNSRHLLLESLEDRRLLAVLSWSGSAGAGDTNWQTAANWVGGVAPSAGDNLVFPSDASQTNTNNNFLAGTSFGSIEITGADYTLAGNAVTLQGGLSDSGGDATVSLPITLGAQSILNTSNGRLTVGAINQDGNQLMLQADYGAITANGEISGAGGLVITGGSGVTLSAANTYTGTTQVDYSTLYIQNAQALGTAAAGTTLLNGASLVLDGSFTVTDELLTVSGYFGAFSSTGTNIWTGDIDIQADIYFSVYGQSLLVSGNLMSTSYHYLQLSGDGVLELAGSNTLSGGQFNVYSGTLQVDDSLTVLDYLTFLYGYRGTLQGAGTISALSPIQVNGALRMSGTVNSPLLDVPYGSVDPAGSSTTAALHTGSVSFTGTTLEMQWNSDTDYDQLKVAGTVNLAALGQASNLQMQLGYTPSVGQQMTLIDNDDTDAVIGTLNGLAEGSVWLVGNVALSISYVGGTGNDVVVTRVPADVWSGGAGAANTNWKTAANWVGGIAPSAGDNILIFPDGPTQRSTKNNFPTGTSFGTIYIAGAGYTLAGNKVTLQGGLSDSGGDATVSLPIALDAPQSIINTSFGTLTVGAIDQNGYPLTLESNSGETIVNGQIKGAGGLVKTGFGGVILAAANAYSGATEVNAGTLTLRNAKALGTANGTVATGTTLRDNAALVLDGSFTIANELLTVSYNASLSSKGANAWTGNIDLQGSFSFDVENGYSLRVGGNLTSTSYQNLTASGGGLLVLAGVNQLSGGNLYVSSSTLQVDKSLAGLNYMEVVYGAILKGAGTVDTSIYVQVISGAIEMTGTVNTPRLDMFSSGLDPAGLAGTAAFHTTGVLSMFQSTFDAKLNSKTAYDRLNVIGEVNLNDAYLLVRLGYTPSIGQQFTLIDNDGTDAVSGTFNGYDEGSLVIADGVTFRISYVGGTGNDVVLTRLSSVFLIQGALFIFGTGGTDNIDVDYNAKNGVIEVKGNVTDNKKQTFNAADVQLIHVMLGDGDDRVTIDKKVLVRAILDGGGGDDQLTAGGGNTTLLGGTGNDVLIGGVANDVLSGGDGDDKLQAGSGTDILIGGRGKDTLKGGNQDDLLIGGFTDYESDIAALDAAMAQWTSNHSTVPLSLGALWDDGDKDDLQGQQGNDLLIGGIGDKLKQ